MSQQPPPLPFTEPPPLPLQQGEEVLSFNNPPSLPTQDMATSLAAPSKEGRLNPNITFLLGIWVGIGLCSVAFCFLAISGRFEPFVRWIQRTAEELESSEPDSAPPSPTTETDTEATTPDTSGAAEKPGPEEQEVITDPE